MDINKRKAIQVMEVKLKRTGERVIYTILAFAILVASYIAYFYCNPEMKFYVSAAFIFLVIPGVGFCFERVVNSQKVEELELGSIKNYDYYD